KRKPPDATNPHRKHLGYQLRLSPDPTNAPWKSLYSRMLAPKIPTATIHRSISYCDILRLIISDIED
ncbi:uncharacterized protein METZ01_LOCUS323911, partial [marine metagenome]